MQVIDAIGPTKLGELADATTLPGTSTARPTEIDRGATIGRYLVIERLGAGGMGVVYAAYDPELDRKVAVKLLRSELAGNPEIGRARLIREAQTMAKLSHPNVVAVHDVGTFGEQVFVAMEFVQGRALSTWLGTHDRHWREVLDMFLQTGRGLAAAHAAGIVHRDFKPDNVLLGADDRPRVTDFGLARVGEECKVAAPTDSAATTDKTTIALTVTGTVMGTPAFMAPEQHLGLIADARSDQFAFCVALWQGLYKQLPFAGETIPQLALAVTSGELAPVPQSDVPAWLRGALTRGLTVDADARWPTLDALLAELGRDRERVRHRRFGLAAVLLLILIIGVFAYSATNATGVPCAGADRAALALWNPEREAALQAAFVAVTPEAGAEISTRLSAHIEHYVGELKTRSMDTCLAYQRGERSDSLYDRQRVCLDRRRGEVEALLTVLATPDAEVAAKALSAVEGLRELAGCENQAALLAQVAPPEPATEAAMPPLLLRLDRVRALRLAGRYKEADAEVTPLVFEIRALGYAPLTAESLIERALLSLELARATSAEEDLLAAVNLAEVAGADELRLAGMTALLRALGSIDVLATLEPQALALVERRGELRRKAHALVLLAAGEGYLTSNEKQELASGRLEAAVTLLEQLGDGVVAELAEAYNNLAMIRSMQDRYGDAHALYQQARRLLERANGPHHPNLGFIANNEGRAFDKEGDREAARSRFAEALALWEPVYGPEHPYTLVALSHLARVSADLGDAVAARGYAERVLGTLGPRDVRLAEPLQILARLELRSGDLESARARSERALGILEHTYGVDSPRLFEALDLASQVVQAQGETGVAIALQERSMAVANSDLIRARARFRLAGIRWESGDYSLALADATAVLAMSELHDEVAAWLAAHPLPSKRHR